MITNVHFRNLMQRPKLSEHSEHVQYSRISPFHFVTCLVTAWSHLAVEYRQPLMCSGKTSLFFHIGVWPGWMNQWHPHGLTSILNKETSEAAHHCPFACGKVPPQNIGGNMLKYNECFVLLQYIISRSLFAAGFGRSRFLKKKPLGELGNSRIWGWTRECKLHVLINGTVKKHQKQN